MTESEMCVAAGLLFFELMFLTFRSMFTALFTFPDEYKMLLKWVSAPHSLTAFTLLAAPEQLPHA